MTKIQPTLQSNSCRPSFIYCLKTVALVLAVLVLGVQAAQAQAAPCPASGSSSNFTFQPQFVGDSKTVTIDLAPCETFELHENHDMMGDGNRGTLFMVSFLNSSDQPIYSQNIFGFYTATNILVQGSYSEPFPWVGIRSPLVQPAKIKLESWCVMGKETPRFRPNTTSQSSALPALATILGVTVSAMRLW